MQSLFDSNDYQLRFEDAELRLNNIYEKMADDLVNDEDIKTLFACVCDRTQGYFGEQPANPSELAAQWKASFSGVRADSAEKRKLIEWCVIHDRRSDRNS